jgi:hypothetical protein
MALLSLKELALRYVVLINEHRDALLHLDRQFLIPEPRIDDPAYTCQAVLVLNAALHTASALDRLPPFMPRHYLYFKQKFAYAFLEDTQTDLQSLAVLDPVSHTLLSLSPCATSLPALARLLFAAVPE